MKHKSDRYDGIPGKEAAHLSRMSKMNEAQHNANNAFVKKHEAVAAAMGMKKVVHLDEKYMRFDQCMISDGEHAQEFARHLTKGLDEKAFPVK